MLVSHFNLIRGGEFEPFGHYKNADDFLAQLKADWWPEWGKPIDVSAPTNYPEFFTVDVTFRSSTGKAVQRFMIPTVGPDA